MCSFEQLFYRNKSLGAPDMSDLGTGRLHHGYASTVDSRYWTRTFKGNRKKVRVIGSSKKIAESKVKNSFYCTVNILITFNCRNVKWKLKDPF